MYYPCRTLSLTTVDSWKTGVIYEVVTPQRQDHVWSAGLLSLKIEWVNSIPVQNWGTCGVITPKDNVKIDKAYLKSCYSKKKKKKKPKKTNWGYMWGRHFSKTRPSLVKPPCNPSPETKDCRVVKPENWVSKLNIRTELGLCVGSSHPQTMSELTKPPCIKITEIK